MRAIDADELKTAFPACDNSKPVLVACVRATINHMPTIEPERKKGKWAKDWWNGEHVRRCSACNISQTVTVYKGKIQFRFCPYCGADMRGDSDESD